ncbi:unnamed protein product [Tuber aestivum]|uniref:Uncharacterized protein n=1 Tax=Tuber aestivum TaxID=59557 RepID=A0A292Q9K4_9PEZI|nr:unnamed protein product [Tuber aestivum]
MVDLTAAIALVVASIALLVTGLQLTQQLLATSYTIRKCDRIISGNLTRGGKRHWHWRQFRFTVDYEGLTFCFPQDLYTSLGLSPSVSVPPDTKTTAGLWDRAMELRDKKKKGGQGCWVSFVLDMAPYLLPENLGRKVESGDRVPEDLTVAPVQVDVITVVLLCIAAGMKFSRYSPATGEISMSGRVGAITSAAHPTLGGLLHYTPAARAQQDPSPNETKMRLRAVNHVKGVWANTIFGRFNDRGIGRGYLEFSKLQGMKKEILAPVDHESLERSDEAARFMVLAAGFMALATVDVYLVVPPTCIHAECAHFAEVIVKAHLKEIEGIEPVVHPPDFIHARATLIEIHGASSPHITWDQLHPLHLTNPIPEILAAPVERLQPLNLTNQDLLSCKPNESGRDETTDPSTFITPTAAWELIMNADAASHALEKEAPGIRNYSDSVVVKSIAALKKVGAPSWGRAGTVVAEWPQTVAEACRATSKSKGFQPDQERLIFAHAKLSILRASYVTVMLRAAGSVGPVLKENSDPVTGLAYMA